MKVTVIDTKTVLGGDLTIEAETGTILLAAKARHLAIAPSTLHITAMGRWLMVTLGHGQKGGATATSGVV